MLETSFALQIDLVDNDILPFLQKRLKKALLGLGISPKTPIVAVSLTESLKDAAVNTVMGCLKTSVYIPQRISTGKFVMSVDHCFPLKGKGTVMTGTVVDGSCKLV